MKNIFSIRVETKGGMTGMFTLERDINDEYAARLALRKWQDMMKKEKDRHPFIVNDTTGRITRIVQWAV